MNSHHIKALLFFCILFWYAGVGQATAQETVRSADAILGQWLTAEGKSKIEIYMCDSLFCGKIVWLKEPDKDGKPRVDDQNPDEKLRDRPVLGLVILRGFTYDGDNVWSGGKIYDPKSGNDYSAKMTLVEDKTMELRGYVLIPLFGRTETWTR